MMGEKCVAAYGKILTRERGVATDGDGAVRAVVGGGQGRHEGPGNRPPTLRPGLLYYP